MRINHMTIITQEELTEWRKEAQENISRYETETVGHEEGQRLLRLVSAIEAAESIIAHLRKEGESVSKAWASCFSRAEKAEAERELLAIIAANMGECRVCAASGSCGRRYHAVRDDCKKMLLAFAAQESAKKEGEE